MIDENVIVGKLQKRIDNFIKDHPDKKNCAEIQSVQELIHLIEQEAEEQSGGN